MEIFIKATAGVLISIILFWVLAKQGKDISVLLTVCVCCMIAVSAIHFLDPVIDLLNRLMELGKLDSEIFGIIIRSTGIGLIAELCGSVCKDAGNDAFGKTLQLLASTVILWMAIPLFNTLISLIEDILKTV